MATAGYWQVRIGATLNQAAADLPRWSYAGLLGHVREEVEAREETIEAECRAQREAKDD